MVYSCIFHNMDFKYILCRISLDSIASERLLINNQLKHCDGCFKTIVQEMQAEGVAPIDEHSVSDPFSIPGIAAMGNCLEQVIYDKTTIE